MSCIDLHVHSTFSDGKSAPEEIVLRAIEKGMSVIGISDHSYTFFDESYCISKNNIKNYVSTVKDLKAKYKNQIEVRLGIEQDYYSESPATAYDYIIGSVHYIKFGDEYIAVDESEEILLNAVDKFYKGDIYKLIEEYYNTLSDVVNKTNADIVGHFDLITKFNENYKMFDESDDRYINAYKKAADTLLKTNALFEINTGAISRGYRTSPYPSNDIYTYLKNNGAKFILSSDSHNKDSLCYSFDNYKTLIQCKKESV